MRIAIISDIHSNLYALTKALALIKEQDVDTIYCLGDIVGYGSHPNECIDLIRKHVSVCVLGNHDFAVLNPFYAKYLPTDGKVVTLWTKEMLTQENREFLAHLRYQHETEIATFVHASPRNPNNWEYIMDLDNANAQFQHFTTKLCFIGHSHIPSVCGEDLKTFHVTKEKDIRFLINVGSIGQPRDGNPQLSFGVFDTDVWTYQNIRAEYDTAGAAQSILDNNLPQSLAQRLLQGV